MMWTLSFKAELQRYNNLYMEKYRKIPDKTFMGLEFQIFPMDYHTWGCRMFVLEAPLQG